jgi:hypothetical protein
MAIYVAAKTRSRNDPQNCRCHQRHISTGGVVDENTRSVPPQALLLQRGAGPSGGFATARTTASTQTDARRRP